MRNRGSARRLRPQWIVPILAVSPGSGLRAGGPLDSPRPGPRSRPGARRGRRPSPSAHRESVVISDNGRVRLGHAVSPVGTLGAARVWDLARTRDGSLLAATGDSGQVFRREAEARRRLDRVLRLGRLAGALAGHCPDGTIFAGTGPNGQVVNLTDPKHPASRPDPKVQYIWDLAADSQGNLYAATGPDGQFWKRSREGRWSLLYDSKSTHLLCVAIGPDGSGLRGQRWRRTDLSGPAGRQGDDPLRCPAVGGPHPPGIPRRDPVRRDGRRSRGLGRLAQLAVPHEVRTLTFIGRVEPRSAPTPPATMTSPERSVLAQSPPARPGSTGQPSDAARAARPRPSPSRRATTPSTGSTRTACPGKYSGSRR